LILPLVLKSLVMGEPKVSSGSPPHFEDLIKEGSTGHDVLSVPRSPTSSLASLFVVLDCVHYVAGDRVTGELLLSLPQALPGGSLVLLSSGLEEVCIYDRERKNARKEAFSQVYKLEQTVSEWEDLTPSGQYVFPFTFKLPQYCPATFSFQGDDQQGNFMKGDITYSISAELRVDDSPHLTLRHSRPMLVRNYQSHEKVNANCELDHVVTGCCWRSKGRTHLKLSVKNEEHCVVAGNVKFKLDPDNSHCSVPINHITGIITQEVVFMLPGSAQNRFERTICNISRATWISPSTSIVYEKDFEYFAELLMPSADLNPSSNDTPLIHCCYDVEAKVHYDLSCGDPEASIVLPLHVDPRNSLERLEPALPKNWAPVENSILNMMVEMTPRTVSGDMLPQLPVPSSV